jgi:hypothetical protein
MNPTPTDPLIRVKHLHTLLEEEEFESTTALVNAFRQEKALLAELPAVFEGALEGILERIESTAMFTEESCSFSQADMLAMLSIWLEKTKSYLEKQLGIIND